MLRRVSLYNVNRASTMLLHAFNAIDRLLSDITANDIVFGGKIILFLQGGNFQPVFLVVSHAHKSLTIENCINHSAGWDSVAKFKLTTKMRVYPDAIEFSEWLLKLGNNNLRTSDKGTNCAIERCIKYQIIVLLIQWLPQCLQFS